MPELAATAADDEAGTARNAVILLAAGWLGLPSAPIRLPGGGPRKESS